MILFLADVRVKVNRKDSSVQNERRRYGNLQDQKQKHRRGRGLGSWQVRPHILAAPQASEIGGVRERRRALARKSLASFWIFPEDTLKRYELRTHYSDKGAKSK